MLSPGILEQSYVTAHSEQGLLQKSRESVPASRRSALGGQSGGHHVLRDVLAGPEGELPRQWLIIPE